MVVGSNPIAFTETSDIASVLSKEFLGIQATTECRFTLEGVHDMIITYKCVHDVCNADLSKVYFNACDKVQHFETK